MPWRRLLVWPPLREALLRTEADRCVDGEVDLVAKAPGTYAPNRNLERKRWRRRISD